MIRDVQTVTTEKSRCCSSLASTPEPRNPLPQLSLSEPWACVCVCVCVCVRELVDKACPPYVKERPCILSAKQQIAANCLSSTCASFGNCTTCGGPGRVVYSTLYQRTCLQGVLHLLSCYTPEVCFLDGRHQLLQTNHHRCLQLCALPVD